MYIYIYIFIYRYACCIRALDPGIAHDPVDVMLELFVVLVYVIANAAGH